MARSSAPRGRYTGAIFRHRPFDRTRSRLYYPPTKQPPILKNNSAQGGTDGLVPTTGNTGGASGDAFDVVSADGTPPASSLRFSSFDSADGGMAYRFFSGNGTVQLRWDTSAQAPTELWARAYIWIGSFPNGASAIEWMKFTDDVGGGFDNYVAFEPTTSKFRATTHAGVNTDSAITIPEEQWIRVEARVKNENTTLGEMEVRIWLDPNSTGTADDTILRTGVQTGNYTDGVTWLSSFGAVVRHDYLIDNVGISTLGWMGPLGTFDNSGTKPTNVHKNNKLKDVLEDVFNWYPWNYEEVETTTSSGPEGPLFAPFTYTNSAEGGVDETTVTTGNSGGASGRAWDTVFIGGGAALVFDDDGGASDVFAYRVNPASAVGDYLAWTVAPSQDTLFVRGLFRINTLPASGTVAIIRLDQGDGTLGAAIRIDNAGAIKLLGVGGAVVATLAAGVPLGQWFKISFRATQNGGRANSGTWELNFFSNPNSSTPTETQSGSGAPLGSGGYIATKFGSILGSDYIDPLFLDNLGISSADYPAFTDNVVYPITDELFPITQGQDQNQVHALHDWAPFNYESVSTQMQAMGVEGSLAPNQSASEDWESYGVEENNATHIHANATSPGGRTDNDVFVGTVSNRFSTLSATSNASYWGISGGWNPQNRIFVRFNIRASRFPLTSRTNIFRWGNGVGPMVKVRSNGSLAIYNEDGTLVDVLGTSLQLEIMSRLEITMERTTATTWFVSLGLAFDPTQGSLDGTVSGTATAITTATDIALNNAAQLGNFATGTDTWGDDGPHAIWFDDFAISTASMPAITGTTPAQGERPSLIVAEHTFDTAQFNALFDWAPFDYSDHNTALDVTAAISAPPGVDGTATPATVVGVGITGAGTSYRDLVIADGPIAYWRLGEPSGTNANDEADSLDGTYAGSPTLGITGAVTGDTAAYFNGSQEVNLSNPTALRLTSAFTLEGWAYIRSADSVTAEHAIVSQDFNGSTVNWLLGFIDIGGGSFSTKPSVGFYTPGWHIAQSADALTTDAWHHLVGTWDGTTLEIWVDKVSKDTDTPGASPTTSTATFYIARDAGGQSKMQIDEVAVYDYKLTSTQIAAHYDNAASVSGTSANGQGVASPATVASTGSVPAPTAVGEDTLFELYDTSLSNIAPYFDWAPFHYGVNGDEIRAMGIEAAAAFSHASDSDTFETGTPGATATTGNTVFTSTSGSGQVFDNDVTVGFVSLRLPQGAVSSALGGADAFTTRPSRMFQRSNVAISAWPLAGLRSVLSGTTNGPTIAVDSSGHLAIKNQTHTAVATSTFTMPFDTFVRLEVQWELQDGTNDAYLWHVKLDIFSDPTSGGSPTETVEAFLVTGDDPNNLGNPKVRQLSTGGDADRGAGIWFDDYAVSTLSMPAPTGTAQAAGERPSLIVAEHTFDQQQFNALFEWLPFDYSDHSSALDVTGSFATPSVDGTASPATVVGIGLVPAPTAIGDANAAPATVVGIGTVPAPTATGTAVAAPATVVGVGSVPAPTAMGNATASPATVVGVGSVPAPTATGEDTLTAFIVAHPSGGEHVSGDFNWFPFDYSDDHTNTLDIAWAFQYVDATASPATVVGTGSVPAPTATGNATASPATVVGTGSVPAPTATGVAVAAPATVVGTGSVPAPTASGQATASPATVVGTGTVPAPTATGEDTLTAFIVAHPSGSEHTPVYFDWFPFDYSDEHTSPLDLAWMFPSTGGTALPDTVVGTGSVPAPTARGDALAAPAAVVGTGSVPAPTAQGNATAAPATVVGTGTVPAPTVTGTATALPAAVVGTGSVPAPTASGNASTTPATVVGTGSVPAPTATGTAVASPATVVGTGTVPAPNATGEDTLFEIYEPNRGNVVGLYEWYPFNYETSDPSTSLDVTPAFFKDGTASPVTVVGTGSVPPATAIGNATALPAAVVGTGSVPPPTVTGTATATPATVDGVGSVPAPTVTGTATAQPGVVAGIGSVPQAAASGGSLGTATPGATQGVGSVPAPTVTGTANVFPAAVDGVGSVPAPSAQGSATAAPSSAAGTGSVPPPTVTGTAVASPATVAGVGSVPPPAAAGNASTAPATVAGIGSVPPPSASGGSVGTATPGATQGVGSVPAPTVTGTATAQPAVVAGVGSVPAPTASGGASVTATPATVAGVGSVPPPTARGNATATPATVAGVGSVPPPTVTGTAVAQPGVVAGIGSVPQPNAYEAQAGVAFPATVAGSGGVVSPAVSGGGVSNPASVAGIGLVPTPTHTGDGLVVAATVAGTSTVPQPLVLALSGFWPQTSNGEWPDTTADEWPQTDDLEWT